MKNIEDLRELGDVIRDGVPTEVLYNLGEGPNKTEMIATRLNSGQSRSSHRISSPPIVKVYDHEGRPAVDIRDSDSNSDAYNYEKLRVSGVTYEAPEHPAYENGNLILDLDEAGNERLAFTQFNRPE